MGAVRRPRGAEPRCRTLHVEFSLHPPWLQLPNTGMTIRVEDCYMTLPSDPFGVCSCVKLERCAGIRKIRSLGMCSGHFDPASHRCAVCQPSNFLHSDGTCRACGDQGACDSTELGIHTDCPGVHENLRDNNY